jgi:hypothetical protein
MSSPKPQHQDTHSLDQPAPSMTSAIGPARNSDGDVHQFLPSALRLDDANARQSFWIPGRSCHGWLAAIHGLLSCLRQEAREASGHEPEDSGRSARDVIGVPVRQAPLRKHAP